MYLYPRLPGAVANRIAKDRCDNSIPELESMSSVSDEHVIFTTVGGTRVPEQKLTEIKSGIEDIVIDLGYPDEPDRERSRKFDRRVAVFLHKKLDIHPGEAGRGGVWSFMNCILVPHLVRWRFPGIDGTTNVERFINERRNVLGRLWWRGFTLKQDESENPYILLEELNEDELVQVMERPNFAGNKTLAICTSKRFLKIIKKYGRNLEISRSDFFREVIKMIRRKLPLLSFQNLNRKEIEGVLDSIFQKTLQANVRNFGQQEVI